MSALFISDLHIDALSGVDMLAQSLRTQRDAPISDLYILGDLFEAWLGDDDDQPAAHAVAKLFDEYRQHGWRIHFLPGNRDFLLGSDYLERFGGRLLPDPSVIELNNQRVLLIHGDRECLADTQYQTVRQQLRNPAWQRQFLAQPLAARRQFAAAARQQSREHTSSQSATIMDADVDELLRLADAHAADVLIHGHTHRPALHVLDVGGRSVLRAVLGDWHRAPSWLRVDEDGFKLVAGQIELRCRWPTQPSAQGNRG